MLNNPIAENVFGTLGLICWTVQLLPQLWKSWREKSTEGLSPWLVFLWAISSPFLGAYAIILNLNIPLIREPQIFGSLCLVSWCQCQHYGAKRSWGAAIAMTLGIAIVLIGFEAGIVLAVRSTAHTGSEAATHATQFLGIFGSVLLGLGLVPQYVEIWRRREVVGISSLLLVLDMLGGICMDLSLAFENRLDVVAGITYSLIVVLEAFVLLAMMILNPRAEKRRQRENAARLDEKRVAERDAAAMSSTSLSSVDSSWSLIKVKDSAPESAIEITVGLENKV
ncbi:PQ loop repeat-domain-containing protein [Mycena haematopus]|nr:PQ loop repeat-domain-containing protein [Mycena haematopus]